MRAPVIALLLLGLSAACGQTSLSDVLRDPAYAGLVDEVLGLVEISCNSCHVMAHACCTSASQRQRGALQGGSQQSGGPPAPLELQFRVGSPTTATKPDPLQVIMIPTCVADPALMTIDPTKCTGLSGRATQRCIRCMPRPAPHHAHPHPAQC